MLVRKKKALERGVRRSFITFALPLIFICSRTLDALIQNYNLGLIKTLCFRTWGFPIFTYEFSGTLYTRNDCLQLSSCRWIVLAHVISLVFINRRLSGPCSIYLQVKWMA